MAKTQILDYYIHLTDQAQVEAYQAQLAAATGPGEMLYIPSTGTRAVLRAPTGAATEFSAPIQEEAAPFTPPCIRSPWFITGGGNFPRNVATFTRKSGGWFGIPLLFGSSTKFYWAGHFVYSPSETVVPDPTTGAPNPDPAPIPQRRWLFGAELPFGGETNAGGALVGSAFISRDAAMTVDGYGLAMRGDTTGAYLSQQTYAYDDPPNVGAAPRSSWERIYVRPRRHPTAEVQFWQCEGYTSSGNGLAIKILPSGQLTLYNRISPSTETLIGTTAIALPLGKRARLDILINYNPASSGGTGRGRLYINGALAIDVTVAAATGGIGAVDQRHQTSQLESTVNAALEWDVDFWRNAAIPEKLSVESLTSQDWVHGSRAVLLRPTGPAADHANWTGDWRQVLQRPVAGSVDGLTSTTAGAVLSLTSDADKAIHALPGAIGAVAIVVGLYGYRGTLDGTLGYALNGAAAVMKAIVQSGGGVPGWTNILYRPSGTTTPVAVNSFTLRHVKGADTVIGAARALFAVAEVIGTFGEEDARPGTVPPVLPPTPGVHNAPYPRSPWAVQRSPLFGAVAVVGGTYVGNGTAQEIQFRVPPHMLWIRPVTGTGDIGAKWFSTLLASHRGVREGIDPFLIAQALVDPAFVPSGAEDAQEVRAIARITGNDAQVNANGVTYQYIAFCDPAARFLLCGAFTHDASSTLPADNPLVDPTFTPEACFFWPEGVNTGATVRLAYKGLGHTTTEARKLASSLIADYAELGLGKITTRAGLYEGGVDFAQVAFAAFRRGDGNTLAGQVLQLATYVGDGSALRVVPLTPASGKRPLFALGAGTATFTRDPSHTGSNSTDMSTGTQAATGFLSGGVDEVSVGTSLNANGVTYTIFVLPGSATAGNNGWSVNGEFIPVEPDSTKPSTWGEPQEITPTGSSGTNPGIGDGPTLDTPDLTDDLADSACVTPTTNLVNLALSRIGVNKGIGTLSSEQSPEANLVRLVYDLSLQVTLRDLPWPFATRYATLTLLAGTSTVPANGDWQYAYRLPDSCLEPRRIVVSRGKALDPTPPPFRLGAGVLFTNEVNAVLEYTVRPHCPARMTDPSFLNAWTWKLAELLAPALTRMADRATFCAQQYALALETATDVLRLGNPGQRPAADPADLDASCGAVKLQVINVALVRIGARTIAALTEQSRESTTVAIVYEDELRATLRDYPWSFATRYASPLTLLRGPAWSTATVQAWSSTVAYVVGDTVKQGGTVYYCLLAHTNQTPPNATYWSTTPTTEANPDWKYAYRAPSESIFVRRLPKVGTGGGNRKFDPEPIVYRMGSDDVGAVIFTDVQDAQAEYTIRPTCALSRGDAFFRDAFAWRLAAAVASTLAVPEPEAEEQTGQRPHDTDHPHRRSESGILRRQQLREQRALLARREYLRVLELARLQDANEQQQEPPGDPDWIRSR